MATTRPDLGRMAARLGQRAANQPWQLWTVGLLIAVPALLCIQFGAAVRPLVFLAFMPAVLVASLRWFGPMAWALALVLISCTDAVAMRKQAQLLATGMLVVGAALSRQLRGTPWRLSRPLCLGLLLLTADWVVRLVVFAVVGQDTAWWGTEGLEVFERLLGYAALCLTVAEAPSELFVVVLGCALGTGVLINTAAALDQYLRGGSALFAAVDGGCISALFTHRNDFARYVALAYPMALSFALLSTPRTHRGVAWVLVAAAVVCLYLAKSRGSLLLALLATAIVLWHTGRRRAIPVLAVAAVLIPLLFRASCERWFRVEEGVPRVPGWAGTLGGSFLANPWLGSGHPVGEGAHSIYVGRLAEAGIPGLATIVGFVGWSCWFALRTLRRGRRDSVSPTAWLLPGAAATVLASGVYLGFDTMAPLGKGISNIGFWVAMGFLARAELAAGPARRPEVAVGPAQARDSRSRGSAGRAGLLPRQG